MITYEKSTIIKKKVTSLTKGDVIFLDGREFVFNLIPQGGLSIYVIAVDDDCHYKINLNDMRDSSYEIANTHTIRLRSRERNRIKDDFRNVSFDVIGYCNQSLSYSGTDGSILEPGDLFVVNSTNGIPGVFRYVRQTPQTIIGINPVDNMEYKIDKMNQVIKINNLKY